MKDVNWIKENYLLFLDEKQENLKDLIKDLQKEERIDEANLEKVRLNIVEIFSKMFNISLNDNPMVLREKYLNFFDKIANPWYISREKALKFGKGKEAIIEDIKIKEVEELKNKFENYYSQMDIG